MALTDRASGFSFCLITDGRRPQQALHHERPGEGGDAAITPAGAGDDEGHDLPVGEIGNLFVRGPSAAQQYWNKPEKTAATMWDGGVLTGDKCYQDAQGNFFYVGRMDDMLRVGGVWVSPTEIESVLAEHPSVLECAVIGVTDSKSGEAVKAFIVKKDQNLSADDVIKYCGTQLTAYKVPKQIEFRTDLPKTNVVGISKLARVVEIYARRLQTQETMTSQILNAIQDSLAPMGAAVLIDAKHECMTTRGVHKTGVSMVTSKLLGSFRDDARTRAEFLQCVGMK